MGQLKKRGRIWWVRYYRNGRRFEESSRSEKRKAAEDLLKIREGDVEKGVPISAKVGQLRFEEAAADLLTDYRVNGKRSLSDVQRRIDKGLRRGSPTAGWPRSARRISETMSHNVRPATQRMRRSIVIWPP